MSQRNPRFSVSLGLTLKSSCIKVAKSVCRKLAKAGPFGPPIAEKFPEFEMLLPENPLVPGEGFARLHPPRACVGEQPGNPNRKSWKVWKVNAAMASPGLPPFT